MKSSELGGGTSLPSNKEGVDAAEAAEDGDDADGLVLDPHQVGGNSPGKVECDSVEQGHAHEYALEEGGSPVHLLLQT